jgi:hypothetical protein
MGGAGQIVNGEIGEEAKKKFISILKKRSCELGLSWCIESWLFFGYGATFSA